LSRGIKLVLSKFTQNTLHDSSPVETDPRFHEMRWLRYLYIGHVNLLETTKYLQRANLKELQFLSIQSNLLDAPAEHFPDFVNALANLHELAYLGIHEDNLIPSQHQSICQMIQDSFSLFSVEGVTLDTQAKAILERNKNLEITKKLNETRFIIDSIQAIGFNRESETTNNEYWELIHKRDKQIDVLNELHDKLSTFEEKGARIQEKRVEEVLGHIVYFRFTDLIQAALNNGNLAKTFIKALPYYIKNDTTFMQNNFDLFFNCTLAQIVGQEDKFDEQGEMELTLSERIYYLQFVLLKGLADEISEMLPPSSIWSFFSKVLTSLTPEIRKGLKELPKTISLETEDKTNIKKQFDKVHTWLSQVNFMLNTKTEWIKLMTAVDKLHATIGLELT